MTAPNEITPAQLNRLIGMPDCPEIVDICVDEDFAQDPFLIPGSFRHSHRDWQALIPRLGGRSFVIVCQKGRKLSQGVASLLAGAGVRAEYLGGGMLGWAKAGGMRVPGDTTRGTLWVTRRRPKVDRIACPWLIRRFIDRDARFMFVDRGEVMSVADKFGAIPFDVEAAAFTHMGECCSFDALLAHYGLTSPALGRLARVIRGADTARPELDPVASGLLAISIGLSRQYRDDQQQLEAGLPFYDALYRWARDGQDETHADQGWEGAA